MMYWVRKGKRRTRRIYTGYPVRPMGPGWTMPI